MLFCPVYFLLLVSFQSRSSAPPAESYDNHLVNTNWRVDRVPFGEQEQQIYSMTPVSDEQFQWGHFISFTEDSFESSYRALCGNDCFTRVIGTYRYVGEYQINITVEEVSYSGFCDNRERTPFSARYKLSFEGDTLTLTKHPSKI